MECPKKSPKKNKRKLKEFPRRLAKGEKKIWNRGAVNPESVKENFEVGTEDKKGNN